MTGMCDLTRPYRAALASRFTQMLQYRSAALAGFATQCWWGGIKVMVLAAFFGASTTAPMSLQDAITYTWVAQALLAMLPWAGDPEIAQAVRSGAVAYDRLRPVDAYALWFARGTGWIAARVLPRAALMVATAALLLPWVGLSHWAWQPPPDALAGALFAVSIGLALLLSTAMLMLINIAVLATLNDRGINVLTTPLVIVFSGNLLPLALFPDAVQTALRWQPLAGLLDTPMRFYAGQLQGIDAAGALALQVFWIAVLVAIGRAWMARTWRTLDVQGG
ncbi:MAG: ABC-2 family transporter protein [Rhizobiales bacterium]|nr:ABC-2 family transporter protein [Rhizobacter sp.]